MDRDQPTFQNWISIPNWPCSHCVTAGRLQPPSEIQAPLIKQVMKVNSGSNRENVQNTEHGPCSPQGFNGFGSLLLMFFVLVAKCPRWWRHFQSPNKGGRTDAHRQWLRCCEREKEEGTDEVGAEIGGRDGGRERKSAGGPDATPHMCTPAYTLHRTRLCTSCPSYLYAERPS